MEMEIEVEKKTSDVASKDSTPDISVLNKAFEILKKAGFPQESLDKAYEMLKADCEDSVEEDVGMTVEKKVTKDVSLGKPDMPGDMKGMMMQAMKSLIERKSL